MARRRRRAGPAAKRLKRLNQKQARVLRTLHVFEATLRTHKISLRASRAFDKKRGVRDAGPGKPARAPPRQRTLTPLGAGQAPCISKATSRFAGQSLNAPWAEIIQRFGLAGPVFRAIVANPSSERNRGKSPRTILGSIPPARRTGRCRPVQAAGGMTRTSSRTGTALAPRTPHGVERPCRRLAARSTGRSRSFGLHAFALPPPGPKPGLRQGGAL